MSLNAAISALLVISKISGSLSGLEWQSPPPSRITIRSASLMTDLKFLSIRKPKSHVAKYSKAPVMIIWSAAKIRTSDSRTVLHALFPTCGRPGTAKPRSAAQTATKIEMYADTDSDTGNNNNANGQAIASHRAAPYQRRAPPWASFFVVSAMLLP